MKISTKASAEAKRDLSAVKTHKRKEPENDYRQQHIYPNPNTFDTAKEPPVQGEDRRFGKGYSDKPAYSHYEHGFIIVRNIEIRICIFV